MIVLATCSVSAFDGDRQGFVAGGGLGFAPVADWSIGSFSSIGEKSSGVAVKAFVGYGYDDNFLIVLQRDGVFNKNRTIDNADENIFQGFTGVVLYYYFGEAGSSFFISSGVGVQDFRFLDSDTDNYKSDFGYHIGAGYEFYEHIQLSGSYTYGKTKTTFKFNHQQLMFFLTYTVF